MENPYRRAGIRTKKPTRVIIEMPDEEVEAIDAWGVPAGMPSRAATVRHLVREGLKSSAKQHHIEK